MGGRGGFEAYGGGGGGYGGGGRQLYVSNVCSPHLCFLLTLRKESVR